MDLKTYDEMFKTAFGDDSWDDFNIREVDIDGGDYSGGDESVDLEDKEDFLKELSKYIATGGDIFGEVGVKVANSINNISNINEADMAAIITSIPMAEPPSTAHNEIPQSEGFVGGAPNKNGQIDFNKYIERLGGADQDEKTSNEDFEADFEEDFEANIDGPTFDDFVEKTSREERQGILVDGIPDAELFFVLLQNIQL